MTILTFDTLKFVETLKESGFSEPQSRGMAVAIQEVQQASLADVATKADIRELKSDIRGLKSDMQVLESNLKSDMQVLESNLKSDIRELDARIMGEIRLNRWMLLLVIAATVLPALKTLFGL